MEEDKRRVDRIHELVDLLNRASEAYYGGGDEVMSNFEWDGLFDELSKLEAETGYILEDSPTQVVGDSARASAGEKEPHEYPALSLQKSKEVGDIQRWAGERPIWLSWKLDGLTLVATYDGGRLTKLLTRGNGRVGTVITFMAAALRGLPQSIAEQGRVVVRGEAVISNEDFELLNATIENEDDRYANARNLAAGTMGMDASRLEEAKERKVRFIAFTLVHIDQALRSWGERMDKLDSLGFETVERQSCSAGTLEEAIDSWTRRVEAGACKYPVDGLVVTFDDTEYAASGSVTGHHATLAGYAYKWQDELAKTVLDHIEWSCAVSAITPVAVFDPVQLEGTTVSRASLCNLSELERLGIGANRKTTLGVIKANKIIPKCTVVYEREGSVQIPDRCPVCGAPTEIHVSKLSAVKTLTCTNLKCPAKNLKKFARCVGKNALDIEGLSVKTLLAFINRGFIAEYADLFHLDEHMDEIKQMEGFGEKSAENLSAAIARSRNASFAAFLYALCIPMIGRDTAKKILDCAGSEELLARLEQGRGFDDMKGIGPERSASLTAWYSDPENQRVFHNLYRELSIPPVAPQIHSAGACAGLSFVITGDVRHFKNRDAFKAYVEEQGGKVTGSVSKKTSFLVNNDINSTSGKNKKARELGIPVISEDDFIAKFSTQNNGSSI